MRASADQLSKNGGIESSQVFSGNGKSPSGASLLAAALNALPDSIAIVDVRGQIVAVNDAWRRHAVDNGMRWPRYGIGRCYLSALDAAASGGDAAVGEMAIGIRRVLAGESDSFIAEYSCETSVGRCFLLKVTAFDSAGARHGMIAHENITARRLGEDELRAAREATEAARREAELRREAAERGRRLAEAVSELAIIESSGSRLEDVLHRMVERSREALGAQAAGIYSAEEYWANPKLVAGSGTLPDTTQNGRSPLTPAILAATIANGRTLPVSGLSNGTARAAGHAGRRRATYHAMLLSSVQRANQLYGYLVLYYDELRAFEADDLEFAWRFGRQISLALEDAELRRRAEVTAVESERSRLARELHDAVTQTLFSTSVVAEALPRVWERDPAEGRRALEELRLWTRGALAEMRTLLMELRPVALIERPLPELLRQLADAAGARQRLPAACQISSEAEPPTEVKLSFYRIAQEALNNISKHACASAVDIRYVATPQGTRLVIRDDGRGFDPDGCAPGRMGLNIMAERARQVGARLAVRSAPGAGTEICVDWRPGGRKTVHE